MKEYVSTQTLVTKESVVYIYMYVVQSFMQFPTEHRCACTQLQCPTEHRCNLYYNKLYQCNCHVSEI